MHGSQSTINANVGKQQAYGNMGSPDDASICTSVSSAVRLAAKSVLGSPANTSYQISIHLDYTKLAGCNEDPSLEAGDDEDDSLLNIESIDG